MWSESSRPGYTAEFSKKMTKMSCIILIVAALWQFHGGAQAQGGDFGFSKPAFFIFGDSLVDPGNNNYIASISRADWRPYGVDFGPSGFRPTGRFTNGQELGQDMLPQPYLAPTTHGQALLNGVNYASGAGGILDSSGAIFLARLSFDTQINYFENTKLELISMLGEDMAMQFLNRSMFPIVFGSNDYLDNYLLPFSQTKAQYSPQDYEELLITHYGNQINRLYNLGARKFMVSGIGPIGCIPSQLSNAGSVDGACIAATNELVVSFNTRLKDLIHDLNSNLPMAAIVYLNTYDVASNVMQNHQQYGLIDINTACCGSGGKFKGMITCIPNSPYCGEDRHKYLFFDAYHPTEAANLIFAARFLDGGPNDAFPINIRQLIAL
ncbi:GDSL esterase/lipase At3g50400 isoform X2 [Cryptomeria japonica]|uniref:GDSL esterase/lipase At3g50400 isoform X2 n=1 Tax=Cryptomeria japonica TaxID=3369 RepID=UPI0025AB5E7C|nr:GDSL esterase/lipase At3g50400 isoform X2 [Cryptomeria japonica]